VPFGLLRVVLPWPHLDVGVGHPVHGDVLEAVALGSEPVAVAIGFRLGGLRVHHRGLHGRVVSIASWPWILVVLTFEVKVWVKSLSLGSKLFIEGLAVIIERRVSSILKAAVLRS